METEPPTLWRELRSWPRFVQVGLAGLAGAVFVSTFFIEPLHDPDLPDRSEWPEGELAEGIAVGEAPAASESDLPEGVERYSGDPLWTVSASFEERAARIDQGVIRMEDYKISLEHVDGTSWTYPWETYGPVVGVADGVVVISEDFGELYGGDEEWPGRRETVALDLDTGEELWRDQEASFVAVYADAVLMTECTGEQDDHIGDCTLYARDPADRSERWSTPTYASAQPATGPDWISEPLPDRLLVESYPTGSGSRTVTVYEDGDSLAGVSTYDDVTIAGDTLIVAEAHDDNPADGCTANVAGFPFGATDPAWEVEAMTRKTADLSFCGELPTVEARDGKLPLTIDGVPSVVDAATGATEWAAPDEGQAVALGPDTLVTIDWEAAVDNLVAYDTATGEERWRVNADFTGDDRTWTAGATLWLYGGGGAWGASAYDVYAYDLATGEGVAIPGSPVYFTPGRIITRDDDAGTSTITSWPTEVW